jgi:hypothetical protein
VTRLDKVVNQPCVDGSPGATAACRRLEDRCGDHDRWQRLSDRYVELARSLGARSDLSQRGEWFGITTAYFASAMANNAVGNYQAALRSASDSDLFSTPTSPSPSADSPRGHSQSPWLLARLSVGAAFVVEFIEAAARCGRAGVAADAVGKLAEVTSGSGTDWGCGVEARCRALVVSDACHFPRRPRGCILRARTSTPFCARPGMLNDTKVTLGQWF